MQRAAIYRPAHLSAELNVDRLIVPDCISIAVLRFVRPTQVAYLFVRVAWRSQSPAGMATAAH